MSVDETTADRELAVAARYLVCLPLLLGGSFAFAFAAVLNGLCGDSGRACNDEPTAVWALGVGALWTLAVAALVSVAWSGLPPLVRGPRLVAGLAVCAALIGVAFTWHAVAPGTPLTQGRLAPLLLLPLAPFAGALAAGRCRGAMRLLVLNGALVSLAFVYLFALLGFLYG